jgi:hypothetical protein
VEQKDSAKKAQQQVRFLPFVSFLGQQKNKLHSRKKKSLTRSRKKDVSVHWKRVEAAKDATNKRANKPDLTPGKFLRSPPRKRCFQRFSGFNQEEMRRAREYVLLLFFVRGPSALSAPPSFAVTKEKFYTAFVCRVQKEKENPESTVFFWPFVHFFCFPVHTVLFCPERRQKKAEKKMLKK